MKSTCPAGLVILLLLAGCLEAGAFAADRSGKYPGWLPADEASPFFPDDGFTISPEGNPWHEDACFRKSFELEQAPRKAVLAVWAHMTSAAVLNGRLVLEGRNLPSESTPAFADVTDQLRLGPNSLEVRVHPQWTAIVYVQLRMEHADGRFEDVVTDESWQWHPAPDKGWPRAAMPKDGWKPVVINDDYYGSRGKAGNFDKTFALMPREMLRGKMKKFNDALRASWPADRSAPKPVFKGEYTDPRYAAQYADFVSIDPTSGQVVDAAGTIRHLFFTIYGQKLEGATVLGVWGFDFDRLEDDLALMEKGEVHVFLRNIGWQSLLDADGNWRRCEKQPAGSNLPEFAYNYEVLDYFLDRCQAHGRFVVIEADFFWGAHWDSVPPPYHTRYYLYPEVAEANALAHRKIFSRYSERPCVALYLMGDEDVQMNHDLENGHLHREFIDYVRGRYGTLDKLAETWGKGYDFARHSQWTEVDRRAEHWPGNPTETVMAPYYPLVNRATLGINDWSMLGLPVWAQYRWPEAPHARLLSHISYNFFTPFDPAWIDYHAFREDVLYLDFVNRWAEIVREAAPNQILFHANGQDLTPHWLFLHFFRRAELDYDVIGVGSHDSTRNLSECSPWDRMRKYQRIIASYRPYALAPGSPAVAIAPSEGCGGNTGREDEILDYYRAQSLELVGHGGAFELCYTWLHLSNADAEPEGRGRLTKVLEWTGGFYRDVEGVKFSLPRDVDVLVVRNNNLQRSNLSGRDYGNVLGLVDFLGQLNIEFDIAMDQDLVYASQPRKIDLGNYRMLFLVGLECDYADSFWKAADAWLCDPAFEGRRSVVVGRVGKRTPYLAPREQFNPTLAKWLGASDYASTVRLEGKNKFTWRPLEGRAGVAQITIDFGTRDTSETGVFEGGRPVLVALGGKAVAVRKRYEGNLVFAFGFPLGLASDRMWGMSPPQDPYDVVASVYEDVLDASGIPRPIRAPHNVRVGASDDNSIIMVQERFGIETTDLCTLALPAGARYKGCKLVPQDDGRTLIRAKLAPYGGLHFKRIR